MAQSERAADTTTRLGKTTTCELCNGEVLYHKRTGQYAIDDDENTEFRFKCQGCGESADLLYMVGIGWEPCHFVGFTN